MVLHPLKTPKKLGRFEVGVKIGGGGMATVYLGRDVRGDGTDEVVALKVIRSELAHDEQFSAMFIDEAKILARLSHPNVIQTLEYGVSEGHRFIAMELLNGRTAADAWDVLAAQDERFDLGTAAWICARVAEGAHSAHELVDDAGAPLNVIHRDVNPTNIFLTHTGDVKLIDFGLARARIRVSKSAEGIVKGKIPYLAPEQAHGHPIDRRIDIYALGTTLWEMATMKRLFKRDTDIATLKAIRDAHVPDPREEDPDFPEALWKIIDRALKRDRDERYATAEDMRRDLDTFARATAPHAQKIATLVERLFPGGEARQARWLRAAAAVRITESTDTMAPPAPVPIASSSLFDDDETAPLDDSTAVVEIVNAPPVKKPAPPLPEPLVRLEPQRALADSKDDASSDAVKADAPKREAEPPPTPAKPEISEAPPKIETPGGTSSKPPRLRDLKATKKGKKKKSARNKPSAEATEAPEDKRKLVLFITTAVIVLFIFALVASR